MNKRLSVLSPVLLEKFHNKNSFDCGLGELNLFLKNYALQNNKNNSSRTYVSLCEETKEIAGYYSLTYGSVSHLEATDKVKKRMPNYPIPVMILARLAVAQNYQKLGLGKALLKDSLLRTIQASNIAGLKAMIAHAKNQKAKEFYLQHGFESSPLDQDHLMLTLQDLQNAIILK